MSYLTIENFKYGRDTRRSELTTRPGALAKCQDAHINQGGEVELRYKFLNINAALTGSFGLQEVGDTLFTFGSGATPPTGWGLYPSVTAASGDLPKITYRRLQDPISGWAMSSVISSCAYDGKDFVVAEFTNGGSTKRYAFYDGNIVPDSYNGVVGATDQTKGSIGWTICSNIFKLPPSLGFTVPDVPALFATADQTFHVNNNNVDSSGFTVSTSKTSAAGTITQAAIVGGGWTVSLGGTWAAGDIYTVTITYNGITYSVGSGNLSGAVMTFCYTFGDRVWLLAGTKAHHSEIGKPYSFNKINGVGNGFINLGQHINNGESLVAMSHYQGKAVFFSRRTTIIYGGTNGGALPADPLQFQRHQILTNTGCIAKLAVQPIGDLDVIYPSDTGIRSVRVRDASNNAIIADIGSPIDALIQASLTAGTETTNGAACSIVEPVSNRYWLLLNGVIYVLTHIPSEKISAWSTYTPSYQSANLCRVRNTSGASINLWLSDHSATDYSTAEQQFTAIANNASQVVRFPALYIMAGAGANPDIYSVIPADFRGEVVYNGATFTFTSNQTAFTPQKMVALLGRVYIRDSNGLLYLFGDTASDSYYDNIPMVIETPWLQGPPNSSGTHKQSTGIDTAAKGSLIYQVGMAPGDGRLTQVAEKGSATAPDFMDDSTFEGGVIGVPGYGTHVKIRAWSGYASGGTYSIAALSALLWHYEMCDEKK